MKFPKINYLLVTGVLVAFAVVGFKVAEDNATPQTGWYEVELISGPNDVPNNQGIGAFMPTPPPLEDEENCAESGNESGVTCAIHLTFEPNGPTSIPATVALAKTAGLLIEDRTAKTPNQ